MNSEMYAFCQVINTFIINKCNASLIYNFRYQISFWPSVANDELFVRVTYFIFVIACFKIFEQDSSGLITLLCLPFTRYLRRRRRVPSISRAKLDYDVLDKELSILPRISRGTRRNTLQIFFGNDVNYSKHGIIITEYAVSKKIYS